MARAHRAQVDETEGLDIDALSYPAEHAGPVAVDAVPHDLPHEATDLLEARDPIELGHSNRHLVPTDFRHQCAALGVDKPRLAGGRADARIALHPLHQQLEVADWQLQVHVELAYVLEVLEVHRVQAGIERLNDARSHLPTAAIAAPYNAQVRQTADVLFQDDRGFVT